MKYGRPEKRVLVQTLPISESFGQFLGADSFTKEIWGGWRRAIVGSSMMVFFAVTILLISMLAGANPTRVQPREATESSASNPTTASDAAVADNATASAAAANMAGKGVEYYLPYPGVLPDNPLYRLKAGRDIVVLWLTFDNLKKAERELLYADKRVNAALVLIEGGKTGLGVSTATKAEKYLELSVTRTVELQDNGRDVKSHLLTLENATAKHVELLREMGNKLSGQEKIVLEKSIVGTEMQLQKVQQRLREEN